MADNEKIYEYPVPLEIAHLQESENTDTIIADDENAPNIQPVTPCEEYTVDMNSPLAVPDKVCYSVEEVQSLLEISRPSVYKLIKQNVFRTVMVAGKHKIVKKSFDKWLYPDG